MSTRDELLGHLSEVKAGILEALVRKKYVVEAGVYTDGMGDEEHFFERITSAKVMPGQVIFDWKRAVWSLVLSNAEYSSEDGYQKRQFALLTLETGHLYSEIFMGLLDVLILAPAR